jgi:hypothetical protein
MNFLTKLALFFISFTFHTQSALAYGYLPGRAPDLVENFLQQINTGALTETPTPQKITSLVGKNKSDIKSAVRSIFFHLREFTTKEKCTNPQTQQIGLPPSLMYPINVNYINLITLHLSFPQFSDDMQKQLSDYIFDENICAGDRAVAYSVWYRMLETSNMLFEESLLPTIDYLPQDVAQIVNGISMQFNSNNFGR